MSHPWFDKVVLCLIVLNSVCLALADPLLPPNATLDFLEKIFNTLFTIEMLIKMIALGVRSGEMSYFQDNWNTMDFFVVCLGWGPELMSLFVSVPVGNFTAIRTIRVLKVLKTIQRVEGVRKLVTSLLNSMPLLLNVGNLLMFIFFVFGIFGSQVSSSFCSTPVSLDTHLTGEGSYTLH